jgi:hypothetical protein
MIELKYALIIRREDEDTRLACVSTHREPRTGTGNNGASPAFLDYCRSVLRTYVGGFSIEVKSLATWKPGINVEDLPPVMWVRKSEEFNGRGLVYCFPDSTTEKIVSPGLRGN